MLASIGTRHVSIEASSAFALAAIHPAIAHLEVAAPATSAPVHWTIVEEDASWRPDAFGPPGAYRTPGGGFAVVQHEPPCVEAFRPGLGIELRAGRAALMAGDFRAHPASFALAASLAGPRSQFLHAGAVAYDGAAVLLIGSSGVGKSTTSLACALAGAGFLGDDLVLVEAGDGVDPVVHSVFATAKLNPDSARALGATAWPPIGTTPKNKAVVALHDRMTVLRSAPIVALIILAPPVEGRPEPTPVRPADAMTLLMPTATPVACRTGSAADLLAVVAALARRLPAWRVPVTWDFSALEPVVRAIARDAAGRRAPAATQAPS